ncbi:MAG: hypothetical protein B6I20_08255 [Bacteroidetes bacterium 4572_117]|nr:MAG: hypothetical protein B6I20_08255 [Bacteroidetes bacterium 4572_117]
MDLENIIYIVATIVIFVVSLLGQNKKKRNFPPQSESEDVEYSLNDFEKILQRKEEFSQTHILEEEKSVDENTYTDELDADKYNKTNVDEKIIKEKQKEIKEKKIEKEEKEDGFDLNSAVIYSSILERKKFRR